MFVTMTALKHALLYTSGVAGYVYIFLNELTQFYLNNTINLRHLTQRILSCIIHKMAIVS